MAVTLDLDASVSKINQKLDSVRNRVDGVTDGYTDLRQASKNAIGGAAEDQDKLAGATKQNNTELDKYAKTVSNLNGHLNRLEKAQRKTTDPTLIKKYNTEIVKTRAALSAVGKAGVTGLGSIGAATTATTGLFKILKAEIATTFAPLAAAGAIVAGIGQIISAVNEYEQIAADLQAITGASGDTLEFLKQSAVEVGLETTISAAQTLEAYKLIASAKPELLDNAQGLAAITREAVTLAEAMGGELPEAATNLTDIMNQYKAPASEAARFTNALAAGSKEGAADIGQLAAAFLVAGTNLKASNVSFEEGVGLFEALAEQGKKGAEAGTGIRNVLAKLSATEVLPKDAIERLKAAGVNMETLSDKSLSFSDRLRALAPIQNDANALVSLFGLENLATGQILLGQIDRIDELTAAVTDTNVAQEQAAIRTSTANAEFTKLKNTITALVQGSGGGLSRLVGLIIAFVRQGVLFLGDVLKELGPTFSGFTDSIGDLFTSIASLLPATKDAAGGTTLFGNAAKIVTVPLKTLFTILSASIRTIGLVINRFAAFGKSSTFLSKIFNILKIGLSSFIDVFINLPAYVSGGIEAVQTFIVGVSTGIAEMASNVGNVLRELFNVKKLITQGTGDLKTAVADLLVNPFEGIGTESAEAFRKGFNATKEALVVPVETKVENTQNLPGIPEAVLEPSGSTLSESSEKAIKEQEKRAQELARARLDALKDGVDKELALEEFRYKDLIARLEKFNLDTSEATIQNERNKLDIKTRFLQEAADLEGLSGQERIKFIYDQTNAEINALETALTAAGLAEEEQRKQIALLRKNASDQYLSELEKLQTAEAQAAMDQEIALLELKRDGFDSQADFEKFKQEEILNIRLKYAEAQLALLEKVSGAEDGAALALRKTINEIKGSLAELNSVEPGTGFSFFSLFGLDENDPENKKIIEGINAASGAALDALSQLNDARLKSANQAIEAADKQIENIDSQIDAAEARLNTEEDLAKKGAANNADRVRSEIEDLKKQKAAEKVERDKAFQEKKKIQTQQAVLDTLTQGSSLLSASAQIFNSVAAIPFVGPIIGAGLVGLMLGSFVAAKAKIFSGIKNQKAEKGYVGTVRGKRHSQGGERAIDHLEVEDNEMFGILSRGATNRFGGAFEAFTNAANKNDKKGMFQVAAGLAGGIKLNPDAVKNLEKKGQQVINFKANIESDRNREDLIRNNQLMEKMLIQMKKQQDGTHFVGNKKIIKKGNFTRVITAK